MLLATGLAGMATASPAGAATLSVDDDRVECPAAVYATVQAAVDAAKPGDTVTVCPGAYVEGSGAVGTSALTIDKDLVLKGAGADLVSITPRSSGPVSGQILESGAPSIHNGIGDVVSVNGTPTKPITVDISGVTVNGYDPNGRPVAVEAGIVFLDARGSIVRSRVTNVVTSEEAGAYDRLGGYRNAQPGYGIAMTSNATTAPIDGTRELRIANTRVDRYNRTGILIDGSVDETVTPTIASGAVNRGVLTGVQVIGRTQCASPATGSCSSVGLLTTGPLFGQDGVRATNAARVVIQDATISQNLVNGTGAPTRSTVASNGTETPNTTNNANLSLGAGIRLQGAGINLFTANTNTALSEVRRSNITDNAYGVINVAADGTTVQTGTPGATFTNRGSLFMAEDNWWGLNYFRTANAGPAVTPAANPPVPENPVTGTLTADGTAQSSSSVDFYPYRSGQQGDAFNGEYPLANAPMPVDDAAPSVALTASAATVEPGDTVTLTADAGDDFGVRRVRFYDGAVLAATTAAAPYAATVTIADDAACGVTRTFTAVASDSALQTAGAAATVAVACPAARPATPTAPPVSVPSRSPQVSFLQPPSTLAGARSIRLSVGDPGRVKDIVVALGARTVCRISADPFTCRIAPTGADVGTQVLRAVLTDVDGRTAEATASVRVEPFTPALALSVATRKVKGGRARRTITGTLVRPDGVTRAQACKGTVTVSIARSGQTFLNQQVRLSSACTFKRSVTARRSNARRYLVKASFGGNAVLSPVSARRRFS